MREALGQHLHPKLGGIVAGIGQRAGDPLRSCPTYARNPCTVRGRNARVHVNSIEYRNTGAILQVTPRINANGMIALDIDQEVSDVATTTSSTINSPTINDRHLVSSIIVHDGETVALGGLIRADTSDTKSGIPVLSEIPGIGPLFRTTARSRDRTELIVLLSPRVVRGIDDARAMTDDLRSRIRALPPLAPKDQRLAH